MKKIIALLLAVVMVLGLVACSSSADKTPDTTPAETTDNTPADTTDTETKTDLGRVGVGLVGQAHQTARSTT